MAFHAPTKTVKPKLGETHVLGTYAAGSRVALGRWVKGKLVEGDTVRIVLNLSLTTGVVVVHNERNGQTEERDCLWPLVKVISATYQPTLAGTP